MENQLRVWWKPQIPMEETFYVGVNSLAEAKMILDTLAKYDVFQLENNIKPDFCNVGGLEMFYDGEWMDWEDEETAMCIDDFTLEELMEMDN